MLAAFLLSEVAVLARIGGRMSRSTGRSLLSEVAALARTGGRYEPAVVAVIVICRLAWLLWPVSVVVMSRTGRYLPYGVAVLARIGGRYEPYWPLLAVRGGGAGPYRRPL